MKIEEKIENLRKQGYCFQDIYQKLGLNASERIAYELDLRKKRQAKTDFSISYLEFAFVFLAIVSVTYLALK